MTPILNPYPIFLSNFIGIISISSMRVLFQPPILLALFWTNLLCWLNAISYCYSIYCVYLFAATALSIWCITHLYIDYLSAPLDQIHLSYTLHLDDVLLFQFSFRGRWSHAIFYVLRVTSLMKQHEECRRSSTMSSHPRKFQSTMRTTTTSWCSISFILIIYLTFYQNLFFSTSFCSLGFAWYRKTNCLGVTKESKNLKPLNGRS